MALREVRETVTKIDKGKLLERCKGKAGLIAEVLDGQDCGTVSWMLGQLESEDYRT